MKHFLLGMMFVGGAAFLGGCPIYPDQGPYPVCGECCSSSDCRPGYACTSQGQCVPQSRGGDDASTSACGDCPSGTSCTLAGGSLQCLPDGFVPADAGTETPDATTPDAGVTTDAGATVSPESGPTESLCNSDAQCVTGGSKCIDGLCTAQDQLCSDGTQCVVAGDSCVDGICLPTCAASAAACPAGYACDFTRGVCSVNPSACSTSAQCQGGAVCVEARCVAPCTSTDAGAQCAGGQVCVNGGCIPDQQARFTCQNEGNVGALASTCDPSSVCLHGDCYAICDGDGGGCAGAGESCKSVTISKGTFAVCATATNLGSDCNAAVGNYCASGKLCIDGSCH